MPLYRKGLVPLTGDPLTNGHLDIIKRAAEQCQEIVVLFAKNSAKAGREVFTPEERVAITETAVRHAGIANVMVLASDGLTVDVFLREGCDRIFRGVRNAADRDYEDELASFNADILKRDVSEVMVYLKAKPEFARISSTAVKGLVQLYLDVDAFVPLFEKQMLEERLMRQWKIGVTGGIAVGKSRVAEALVAQAAAADTPAKHVSIDNLLRDLYAEPSAGAQGIRDAIAARFGNACLTDDRKDVNRPALSRRITEIGSDALSTTEGLTKPHVHRKYREALAGFKGLVVLEWSQIAEMGMSGWVNGNVIVVDSPDRDRFIAERGIDPARLAAMDAIQWSASRKLAELQNVATANGHGTALLHQNVIRPDVESFRADIDALLDSIRQGLPSLPKTSTATP